MSFLIVFQSETDYLPKFVFVPLNHFGLCHRIEHQRERNVLLCTGNIGRLNPTAIPLTPYFATMCSVAIGMFAIPTSEIGTHCITSSPFKRISSHSYLLGGFPTKSKYLSAISGKRLSINSIDLHSEPFQPISFKYPSMSRLYFL